MKNKLEITNTFFYCFIFYQAKKLMFDRSCFTGKRTISTDKRVET